MSETDILREAAKLVCFNCRNNSPREHVCAARAIWARIAQLESVPQPEETLDDLAHEIAEEDCKSLIESHTLTACAAGTTWYNLASITDDVRWFIDRAVKYLDGAAVLKHCPSNPDLVGWDEDEASAAGESSEALPEAP